MADFTFDGTTGNDVLQGDVTNDLINGLEGNDSISTIGGNDTLRGGAGNDTLSATGGLMVVEGGQDSDVIIVGAGLQDGSSMTGGGGNDILTLDLADDVTIDLVAGTMIRPGQTYVVIAFETVLGGLGSDTINGGSASELLGGGSSGNDLLSAASGNDTLQGGSGNDTMSGGNGNDLFTVAPGAGFASIIGGNNVDTIDLSGSSAGWVLLSNATGNAAAIGASIQFGGVERIIGSDFNDTISDAAVVSTIMAGNGNDTVIVDTTTSTGESFGGGDGIDTLDLTAFGIDMQVNLATGSLNRHQGISGFEIVQMGSGNDSVTGSSLDDTFSGGNGNDTLSGGLGVNSMTGGGGNDVFAFTGALSINSVNGSGGVDTLDLSLSGTGWVVLGDSTASNAGASIAFTGVEIIIGTNFTDTISDAPFVSTILAGNGNDTVIVDATTSLSESFAGQGGNDTLDIQALSGGASVNLDTGVLSSHAGISGFEAVIAGSGNDTLTGSNGNDTLTGGAGADILTGGLGADTLLGGDGSDTIVQANDGAAGSVDGGNQTDTLDLSSSSAAWVLLGNSTGTSGGTTLSFTAVEIVIGTAFNDTLSDAPFVSTIRAGEGNDTVIVDATTSVSESFAGEGGTDTLDVQALTGNVSVDLAAGTLSSHRGISGFEAVIAGGGNDTLTGSTGNEALTGGAGHDLLDGGTANDTLTGGLGNDTMLGSDGSDLFAQANDGATNSVNGGNQTDTLDLSSSTAAWVLLGDSTGTSGATAISFTAVEIVIGSDFNDTISDAPFVSTIRGGAGQDTVIVDSTTSVSESFGGDAGTDTLDLQALTGGVDVNLAAGTLSSHRGVSGFEIVVAGSGNDTITGMDSGTNTLFGDAGNDRFQLQGAREIVHGGLGNDTFVFLDSGSGDTRDDELFGDEGIDTLDLSVFNSAAIFTYGGASSDMPSLMISEGYWIEFTGIENIIGSTARDVIDEDGAFDMIMAGDGDDVVTADDSASLNDSFDGGNGLDTLNLELLSTNLAINLATGTLTGHGGISGFEFILGGAGHDTFTGSDADEILFGSNGNDSIHGGNGNDFLDGGDGNDTLLGEVGNDTFGVTQSSDHDSLNGGTGTDTLDLSDDLEAWTLLGDSTGSNSNGGTISFTDIEIINGTRYGDTLSDAPFVRTVDGGGGADIIVVDATASVTELFIGGNDLDTLDVQALSGGVTVNLATGTLSGHAGAREFEAVLAGIGNDNITGDAESNTLIGGAGNDTLSGGGGTADLMVGGVGNDVFVFAATANGINQQGISDFVVGEDMLHLAAAAFAGLSPGALSANAFVANTSGAATTAAHRIIYEIDTGRLFFDADGSGAGAAVQFGFIGSNLALDADDILII